MTADVYHDLGGLCYSCGEPLDASTVVWLGADYEDGDGSERVQAWAFHPKCAAQQWPLFEVDAP